MLSRDTGIEILVIGWDWMWVVTWGMAGDCERILLADNAEGAYLLLSEEWKGESYWYLCLDCMMFCILWRSNTINFCILLKVATLMVGRDLPSSFFRRSEELDEDEQFDDLW